MIARRKKIVAVVLLVAITVVAVCTNPSEEQHLDKFVANYQAWQHEHARSCSVCKPVRDVNQIYRHAMTGYRDGHFIFGEELRRKNFLLFSILANPGWSFPRTYGCLGFVLGPTFAGPYPCPKDLEFKILTPELDTRVVIKVPKAGVIQVDGKQVTLTELEAWLTGLEDKERTAVEIRVNKDITLRETNKIELIVKQFSFAAHSISIVANSD